MLVQSAFSTAQCRFTAGEKKRRLRTDYEYKIERSVYVDSFFSEVVPSWPQLGWFRGKNYTFRLPRTVQWTELGNSLLQRSSKCVHSDYPCNTDFWWVCVNRAEGTQWPHSEWQRLRCPGISAGMTFGNFVKAVLIIYAFSLASLMNTSLTVLQDRRNGIRRGKVHYEEATWWKLASLLDGSNAEVCMYFLCTGNLASCRQTSEGVVSHSGRSRGKPMWHKA